MNVVTDPKQAGERLLQFVREGRLVQGEWLGKEDGREIACLLGAAVGISAPTECPASLMPAWLAHALPSLFDGQTEAHAQTFAIRWGEAMVRPEWQRISWGEVRAEWMAFIVKQAKDAAASASLGAKEYAADAKAEAASAAAADHAAANAYASARAAAASAKAAAKAAAYAKVYDRYDRYDSWVVAYDAARDAQADALMDAIERAMEVARG